MEELNRRMQCMEFWMFIISQQVRYYPFTSPECQSDAEPAPVQEHLCDLGVLGTVTRQLEFERPPVRKPKLDDLNVKLDCLSGSLRAVLCHDEPLLVLRDRIHDNAHVEMPIVVDTLDIWTCEIVEADFLEDINNELKIERDVEPFEWDAHFSIWKDAEQTVTY